MSYMMHTYLRNSLFAIQFNICKQFLNKIYPAQMIKIWTWHENIIIKGLVHPKMKAF